MSPSVQDFRFPIGKKSLVLCHVRNGGGPLNITSIMGSLNFPFDFGIQLSNLSSKSVHVEIPAGAEATLEYLFAVGILGLRRFTRLLGYDESLTTLNARHICIPLYSFLQMYTRSSTKWPTRSTTR